LCQTNSKQQTSKKMAFILQFTCIHCEKISIMSVNELRPTTADAFLGESDKSKKWDKEGTNS
jgi:hypothetical protein